MGLGEETGLPEESLLYGRLARHLHLLRAAPREDSEADDEEDTVAPPADRFVCKGCYRALHRYVLLPCCHQCLCERCVEKRGIEFTPGSDLRDRPGDFIHPVPGVLGGGCLCRLTPLRIALVRMPPVFSLWRRAICLSNKNHPTRRCRVDALAAGNRTFLSEMGVPRRSRGPEPHPTVPNGLSVPETSRDSAWKRDSFFFRPRNRFNNLYVPGRGSPLAAARCIYRASTDGSNNQRFQ